MLEMKQLRSEENEELAQFICIVDYPHKNLINDDAIFLIMVNMEPLTVMSTTVHQWPKHGPTQGPFAVYLHVVSENHMAVLMVVPLF